MINVDTIKDLNETLHIITTPNSIAVAWVIVKHNRHITIRTKDTRNKIVLNTTIKNTNYKAQIRAITIAKNSLNICKGV